MPNENHERRTSTVHPTPEEQETHEEQDDILLSKPGEIPDYLIERTKNLYGTGPATEERPGGIGICRGLLSMFLLPPEHLDKELDAG